jgi:hypothetical protein
MARFGMRVPVLALLAVACSSSLGSEGLDVPPEGVTSPIACSDPDDPRPQASCPDLPALPPGTARALVDSLRGVAAAAYGTDVRWTGRVTGRGLARTGKPSSASTAGWATAFCKGDDALDFDVTAGACGARNLCGCATTGTCGGAACGVGAEAAFPAVDSDRAISAAFPDDPATGTYDADYDAPAGQWTVTRLSDGTRTLVDGTSGNVI